MYTYKNKPRGIPLWSFLQDLNDPGNHLHCNRICRELRHYQKPENPLQQTQCKKQQKFLKLPFQRSVLQKLHCKITVEKSCQMEKMINI